MRRRSFEGLAELLITGEYIPQVGGEPYGFHARWHRYAEEIYWRASIDRGHRFVAKRHGRFNLGEVQGGHPEHWVRTAIELAIEKLAKAT